MENRSHDMDPETGYKVGKGPFFSSSSFIIRSVFELSAKMIQDASQRMKWSRLADLFLNRSSSQVIDTNNTLSPRAIRQSIKIITNHTRVTLWNDSSFTLIIIFSSHVCRFVLMHLPGKITYKEIDEMIKTVDKNEDWKISYSEFRVRISVLIWDNTLSHFDEFVFLPGT